MLGVFFNFIEFYISLILFIDWFMYILFCWWDNIIFNVMYYYDKISRKIKMKKLIIGVLLSVCIVMIVYVGGKYFDECRGGSVFLLYKMEKVFVFIDE